MRTLKIEKIVLLFIIVIFASCTSYQYFKKSYRIGDVRVNSITKSQYEDVVLHGQKIAENPNAASYSFYVSKDLKVTAMKTILKATQVTNFQQRYENMYGLYGEADLGNCLLSSDSLSNGHNWVYAVEYKHSENALPYKMIKKIILHLESNQFEIGIVTDEADRANVIKLMDLFTMELMHVKLKLKSTVK